MIRRETKALALLAKVDPERVTVVKTKADAVIEDDAVQLVVSDGLEVFLPQQDLAKDVKKELDRLSTQLKKLVKDIGGLEGRLGNPGFADKAPADVVAATRASLEEQARAEGDARRVDRGAGEAVGRGKGSPIYFC